MIIRALAAWLTGQLRWYRWRARDPGKYPWFEYHCWESEESSDAELWHRTHQRVHVVSGPAYDGEQVSAKTAWRLVEEGESVIYRVRFADGFEGDVFEDELLTGPEHYIRPDYMQQQ